MSERERERGREGERERERERNVCPHIRISHLLVKLMQQLLPIKVWLNLVPVICPVYAHYAFQVFSL